MTLLQVVPRANLRFQSAAILALQQEAAEAFLVTLFEDRWWIFSKVFKSSLSKIDVSACFVQFTRRGLRWCQKTWGWLGGSEGRTSPGDRGSKVKTQSPQKVKKKTLMVKLVRCNVFRILDYMNKVECYSYMYPDLKLLMKWIEMSISNVNY